jgi:hypothetical protein
MLDLQPSWACDDIFLGSVSFFSKSSARLYQRKPGIDVPNLPYYIIFICIYQLNSVSHIYICMYMYIYIHRHIYIYVTWYHYIHYMPKCLIGNPRTAIPRTAIPRDIDDVSMIPPQSPAHVGDQPVNQSTWQGSRDGTRSSHCKHDI